MNHSIYKIVSDLHLSGLSSIDKFIIFLREKGITDHKVLFYLLNPSKIMTSPSTVSVQYDSMQYEYEMGILLTLRPNSHLTVLKKVKGHIKKHKSRKRVKTGFRITFKQTGLLNVYRSFGFGRRFMTFMLVIRHKFHKIAGVGIRKMIYMKLLGHAFNFKYDFREYRLQCYFSKASLSTFMLCVMEKYGLKAYDFIVTEVLEWIHNLVY